MADVHSRVATYHSDISRVTARSDIYLLGHHLSRIQSIARKVREQISAACKFCEKKSASNG